jgi:hypothetical protein
VFDLKPSINMDKTIKPFASERRKMFIDRLVKQELGFWLDRNIHQPWDKKSIKSLVKIYWAKGEGKGWIYLTVYTISPNTMFGF